MQRQRIGARRLSGLWPAALVAAALLAVDIAAAERTRSIAVTEDRVALVIGNASYPTSPLDNPVNDARLIADALQKAGFKVARHENLNRGGMINAVREFGDLLTDRTVAVFFYSGHAVQVRDHNYLVPVDVFPRSEDEVPVVGLDVGFVLGRMSHARSRINIVILDACRDNPFAGKTRPARGLAQMDAPAGTLIAFSTAPGKVAEDNTIVGSSLYSGSLAKHLTTPGLPVETVFKRVREAVIQGSDQRQVPWESSSLLGEFAFVPGMATPAVANAEQEAAGELAFWNSIQSSSRAEEYRAYLRQYPKGRFTELARTRIAAFSAAAASAQPVTARVEPQVAALLTRADRPELLPRAGDSWRYRVQDQFRIGDLFLTATVSELTADGIVETWTTTSDAKVRSTLVPLAAEFSSLPGWSLTPPQFAPYLLAAETLRAGQKVGDARRTVEQAVVPLKAVVEGVEDIVVAAGRFRATKIVLRGRTQVRGSGPISVEHVIWYAPEVKRYVKYTVSTSVGRSLQEATSFELTEFNVN